MEAVQAATQEDALFSEDHLHESIPSDYPEFLKLRELRNRFSKAVILEITDQDIAERFIPESPIRNLFDLFCYLNKYNEELASNKMDIRRCFGCDSAENLHIASYKNSPKGDRHSVKFLKKIGSLSEKSLPRYLFNHGEGFGAFTDDYCPCCSRRIRDIETGRRLFRDYVTTA